MRKTFSIPGGIHPPENKLQSLGRKIRSAGLPPRLVLPLAQHIGAPAEPVVAVGDRVLKGQLIGRASGFVSVPCHAPTSGEVVAIGKHRVPHPSAMEAACITLAPDGLDEWIPHAGAGDYRQLDKSTLLQLIRDAGIAGMGGAGFPTAVKLATDKPIEYLIINGTECEPYITADDALMRERADDIVQGVEILRHLVAPANTLIGIEDNKPQALDAMTRAAAGSGIEVVTFPTRYPSGGERQLIQILTGKEVPSGGLPAAVGVVMQNVGTAYAVYRAIGHGEPLLSRITTVTGDAVADRGNFEVLLGTPVQHLMTLCGLRASAVARLIMGGPMMGFTLESAEVPIVKTTNCLLAASRREVPAPAPPQACIRCGMCAQACPASLLPQQLYWFAQGKEYDKLEQHHLFDCIECGCCSYVCPSNIPLVQYYRASKATITTMKRDAVKSEHARERFEARQQRIEREQAEKEARRKARSSKAGAPNQGSGSTDKAAAVEAAVARAAAKKAAADPAADAIARAQSARQSPPPAGGSQTAIAKLEQRLAAAEAKLQLVRDQGGDKVEAFANSVKVLQDKLTAARAQAVAGAPPAADAGQETAGRNGPAQPDGANAETPAPEPRDPAQAAIARAQAARSGNAGPVSAAQQAERLRQRLDKARERYDQARSSGNDQVEAFAAAVSKLEQQLQRLAAAPTVEPGDAAATNTPATVEQPIAQLEQRLLAARTILARAIAEDSPERAACQLAVDSLERELQEARPHPDG